jgi:hypothetical protein
MASSQLPVSIGGPKSTIEVPVSEIEVDLSLGRSEGTSDSLRDETTRRPWDGGGEGREGSALLSENGLSDSVT